MQHKKLEESHVPLLKNYGDRDIDNAAKIDAAMQKKLAQFATLVGSCCTSCCMSCGQCLKAFATCCESFSVKVAEYASELGPLLVYPIGRTIKAPFTTAPLTRSNEDWSFSQPVIDVAGAVLNPVAITADAVLPISSKGGWGIPVLPPILGRSFECVQLMADAYNLTGTDRIQNPVAAVTGISLGLYLGLQMMALTNGLLVPGQTLHDNLHLNPKLIINNLLHSDPTALQKAALGIAGYIGLTNGYLKGKEFVLHEVSDWWKNLRAQVESDGLERHLDALEKLDGDAAEQADKAYQSAKKAGKAWHGIDMTGRMIESLLKIPVSLIKAPAHNMQYATNIKGWLMNTGAIQRGKQQAQVRADSCATSVSTCFGWRKPAPSKSAAEAKYEDYENMLKRRRGEYNSVSVLGNSIMSKVSRDKREGAQRKLDNELEQRFLSDVAKHHMGQPVSVPVLPSAPPPPYNDQWAQEAAAYPQIEGMLEGRFPNPSASLHEKARLYNECLYHVYSGKSETVAHLCAQVAPPQYDEDIEMARDSSADSKMRL